MTAPLLQICQPSFSFRAPVVSTKRVGQKGGGLFLRLEQSGRVCFQRFCDSLQVVQADVGDRALHLADIGAMEATNFAKTLLRPILCLSHLANVLCKPPSQPSVPKVCFLLINFVHSRRVAELGLCVYSSTLYRVYFYCLYIYTAHRWKASSDCDAYGQSASIPDTFAHCD